jgi:peroxiredoxin Q/BCP
MTIKPLAIGDTIPDFQTTDEAGQDYSSKSLRGSPVIIYFYPRDNTPGCTLQACDLRDNYEHFLNIPITILGISGCSLDSHQKFKTKNSLPFPLLLDEGHRIAKSFGVWGEKKFMGKSFEGIHRTTFLISKTGNILKTYLKVKPSLHSSMVLEDVRNLRF